MWAFSWGYAPQPAGTNRLCPERRQRRSEDGEPATMKPVDKLYTALAAAHKAAPGPFTEAAWKAAAVKAVPALGKEPKPPAAKPINKMTDAEFTAYLQAEPSLAGIDIERERGKCLFHFKAKGVIPSRMRLINWLGRADKTLARHGRDAETRQADADERKVPTPHGWVDFMKTKQAEWIDANPGYDAPGTAALEKRDFFGMPKAWRDECRSALP